MARRRQSKHEVKQKPLWIVIIIFLLMGLFLAGRLSRFWHVSAWSRSSAPALNMAPAGTPSAASSRSPETMQAATSTVTASEARYIGNRHSRIFHRLTCPSLPATWNRVYFKTREDAIAQGYRPCPICQP